MSDIAFLPPFSWVHDPTDYFSDVSQSTNGNRISKLITAVYKVKRQDKTPLYAQFSTIALSIMFSPSGGKVAGIVVQIKKGGDGAR